MIGKGIAGFGLLFVLLGVLPSKDPEKPADPRSKFVS